VLPISLHENDLLGGLLGNLGTISQLLFTVLFIALFFGFGQKLQMRQFLWEIDKGLRRLDMFRNSAKDLTLKTVKEIGKPLTDPGPQINVLMEQFLRSGSTDQRVDGAVPDLAG